MRRLAIVRSLEQHRTSRRRATVPRSSTWGEENGPQKGSTRPLELESASGGACGDRTRRAACLRMGSTSRFGHGEAPVLKQARGVQLQDSRSAGRAPRRVLPSSCSRAVPSFTAELPFRRGRGRRTRCLSSATTATPDPPYDQAPPPRDEAVLRGEDHFASPRRHALLGAVHGISNAWEPHVWPSPNPERASGSPHRRANRAREVPGAGTSSCS